MNATPDKSITDRATDMTRQVADDKRERVQQREYAQFVAISVIEHNGVRAYNVGDPVPASNVEAHGYLDAGLVAKVGSAAASSAQTPEEA